MSKFIDRLKDLAKDTMPHIGFRAAAVVGPQSLMTAVVRFSAGAKEIVPRMREFSDLGVDAVVIAASGASPGDMEAVVKAARSVPVGAVVEGNDGMKAAQLASAGIDFIVFGLSTAATVIESKDIGKVLEVRYDTGIESIRSSAELESLVDAVCISGITGAYVSIEHLLAYRRLVRLFRAPLIAETPAVLGLPELKSVWDAGVDGVMLPDSAGGKAVADLKKMMGSLSREGRRRWGAAQPSAPILPRVAENRAGHEHGEEDEED